MDLTHICIKVTSLLAIQIEIILPYPLRLWLINLPAVIKRLKELLQLLSFTSLGKVNFTIISQVIILTDFLLKLRRKAVYESIWNL